jgi:hypothetical protein
MAVAIERSCVIEALQLTDICEGGAIWQQKLPYTSSVSVWIYLNLNFVASSSSSISTTALSGSWLSQISYSKLIPSSFSLSAPLGRHTHHPVLSVSVFPVVGPPFGSHSNILFAVLKVFILCTWTNLISLLR